MQRLPKINKRSRVDHMCLMGLQHSLRGKSSTGNRINKEPKTRTTAFCSEPSLDLALEHLIKQSRYAVALQSI